MSDRERLHELNDKLPEEELPRIETILEEACTPDTYEGPSAVEEIRRIAAELTKDIPDEEWERLPSDLSYNHDHYLYGTPKNKE